MVVPLDDACPLSEDEVPSISRCKTPDPGTGSLTLSCLKTMINTVYRVFGNYTSPTTILTAPDSSLIMYKSGNGSHAEEKFIDKNKHNLSGFPTLWINNSPCTSCAQKLMTAYQNESTKPTFYAGHFYTGGNTEGSLQCLAKMVSTGFTLKAFDWTTYKGLVNVADCVNAITFAQSNASFVDKVNSMTATVNKVYDYSSANKTKCP